MAPSLELGNTRKFLDDQREAGDQHFAYAIQLATSSELFMSLQFAIELGVFDIIAKAREGATLSLAEIAAQLPTTSPAAPIMLDRILRLLASHSVIRCSLVGESNIGSNFHGLYSLCFVTNEDGVSLGPFLALVQDKVFLKS